MNASTSNTPGAHQLHDAWSVCISCVRPWTHGQSDAACDVSDLRAQLTSGSMAVSYCASVQLNGR